MLFGHFARKAYPFWRLVRPKPFDCGIFDPAFCKEPESRAAFSLRKSSLARPSNGNT
jgi:hypothetical protein